MPPDSFEPGRRFNSSYAASSISTRYAPVFPICLTLHPTHNSALNFSFHGYKNQLLQWRLSVGIFKWQKQLFRDLKPENILLDSKGNSVITNFGLTKLNMTNYRENKIILRYSRVLSSWTLKSPILTPYWI